jgi:hypothetical protein
VSDDRRRPREPLPPLPADALPIVVRDRGPFVHYPASADDLRAVLARLPPGVANGIAKIELLLEEGPEERADRDVDPFVGRLAHAIAPGLYGPSVLGFYQLAPRIVRLFAYVYDPSRPDRVVVDLFLRLTMLKTFVHELAHHQDYATRGGRRQWRRDDDDVRETYARELEHAWTQDHVVPYLVEAYPSEVDALTRWLEVHGGKSVSLGVLAGDPRWMWPPGGDAAFEDLLERVSNGERPPDTHVGLAHDLAVAEQVDDALEILDRVLRAHPGHQRALVARGGILLDERRLDEANVVAAALEPLGELDADAWELVRDVARERGEWQRVIAACKRLFQIDALPSYRAWSNRKTFVLALLELGANDDAEVAIAWLREWEWPVRFRAKELAALEHAALLRRGA